MNSERVYDILKDSYDDKIAEKIITTYLEVENNFFLEKWMPTELDAWHFVESVRRLIEFELNEGSYTPFSSKISNFTDKVLSDYEKFKGHESFRILIPRVLKSIYNIRNKRWVGHISDISPNEMDSTIIIFSVKWILSEIIRLKSNLTINETQEIIDLIVERKINLIWKHDDFKRVLHTNINTKDKILILLYDDNNQNTENIRLSLEYKNKTNFYKILTDLHKNRYLEYNVNKGICIISPIWISYTEAVLKKLKYS